MSYMKSNIGANVLANFGSNQEEDIGFLVYSVVPCEIVLYLNQMPLLSF